MELKLLKQLSNIRADGSDKFFEAEISFVLQKSKSLPVGEIYFAYGCSFGLNHRFILSKESLITKFDINSLRKEKCIEAFDTVIGFNASASEFVEVYRKISKELGRLEFGEKS